MIGDVDPSSEEHALADGDRQRSGDDAIAGEARSGSDSQRDPVDSGLVEDLEPAARPDEHVVAEGNVFLAADSDGGLDDGVSPERIKRTRARNGESFPPRPPGQPVRLDESAPECLAEPAHARIIRRILQPFSLASAAR